MLIGVMLYKNLFSCICVKTIEVIYMKILRVLIILGCIGLSACTNMTPLERQMCDEIMHRVLIEMLY